MAAAFVFVVLLIRVGYILSSNTIGELTQELLYLRMTQLRLPLYLGLGALVLEIAEMVFHALVLQELIAPAPHIEVYLNAVQALTFLASGLLFHNVIRMYTPLGIERRIEENMESIALLSGTRRRRRTERTERTGRDRRRGKDEDEAEEREERRTGERRRIEARRRE